MNFDGKCTCPKCKRRDKFMYGEVYYCPSCEYKLMPQPGETPDDAYTAIRLRQAQ